MYALGSSYLIRQAAGAERFGGVTVKIRPRKSSEGTIAVILKDRRTGELIEDDVSWLADAAIQGVKRFASENSVNLDDWEVEVSDFAYHPTDSAAFTTEIAAYNAIASAIGSWAAMTVQLKCRNRNDPGAADG